MNEIYKRMIDDSPIAYICVDVVMDEHYEYKGIKIIDANKSFESLFNTKLKYMINKEIDGELIDAEDLNWKEVLKKAIENDKYIIKKYMKSTNVYLSIEVYYMSENRFAARFMEVNREYMNLSSIFRNSAYRAWIKDRSGRYVDVNNIFLEAVNMSRDELIGKNDIEIFGDEIGGKYLKEDNIVMNGHELYMRNQVEEIGDNGVEHAQVAKWSYTDKNNNILGTIGIAMDITDKVKLRENLEKNEANFMQIAEYLEEVFIIRDKTKALYISPSFEKLFGKSPDKLYISMDNWSEYFDEDDILKSGPVIFDQTCDKILKLKSNNSKWIWCKFVPIKSENGEVERRVGIIGDITKKVELERELENLRMDFFANLSHELRTPINLIVSSLQVLDLRLDRLERDDFNYFEKYLNIISQNGLRLLKLVNNLIDTTKLDSNHIHCDLKNHDIISFVEDICASVTEFVKRNGLNIIFDTNTEEKITSFDLDHMERIILNLLSNAIKFNKPNGLIEINIICEDDIKISIKDTGVGIPEDKLDSIFGRFEQVRNKMKTENEGSGIGLSLVKSLVEMHKGNIEVKSKLGEGSEFIISLPEVLVEDEFKDEDSIMYDTIGHAVSVNRMNVEFSDIYV